MVAASFLFMSNRNQMKLHLIWIELTLIYFELVFTTIDYNGRNLLIHEDKNRGQHRRSYGGRNRPPRIVERRHDPTAPFPRRFKFVWHDEFWCSNAGQCVQSSHGANRDEDTEITNDHPHLAFQYSDV